jgi:hypothetical protein
MLNALRFRIHPSSSEAPQSRASLRLCFSANKMLFADLREDIAIPIEPFVVTHEPASFRRLKDMLRKLTTTVISAGEGTAYDAACLIVADWNSGTATLRRNYVPDDLDPALFSRSFSSPDRPSTITMRRASCGSRASHPVSSPKLVCGALLLLATRAKRLGGLRLILLPRPRVPKSFACFA